MRLLADTHVALWALDEDQRLGPDAAALLVDSANQAWVSQVALFKIAVKRARPRPARSEIRYSVDRAAYAFAAVGFEILPITLPHLSRLESLPQLHGDPFDRLMAAQALHEGMRLLTADKVLAAYSDTFILA